MLRTRRGWRRTVVSGAALTLAGAVVAGTAGAASADTGPTLGYDAAGNKGSLWQIADEIGAHDSYRAGWTGKGIGVALIDTGVTPVPGLDTGNLFQGPDLSFDSQDPELEHRDAYGHGTHLASIIAGRDVAGTPASYTSPDRFDGIAPDANLVDVKVGASDGAVDVSQVIAAIDWVVQHRDDDGLDIRVINLSYGTDSLQSPAVDPLAYAVEQAWKAGIVVVVAGGNDGSDRTTLADPARDPYVLAVGADDTQGTPDWRDDAVPSWGSRGENTRHVDLVAPGVSVLGARVPNGYADERNPQARVGDRFARASGTSQAAAVVSGAVALLLQAHPELTPDQVKQQLMTTAHPFATAVQYRGSGLLDVAAAETRGTNGSRQNPNQWGSGTGSLEASRGSFHVNDGVGDLTGEQDIFGRTWDGPAWAAQLASTGTAWSGGSWRGLPWTGTTWNGQVFDDVTWPTGTWNARSWRGDGWSARSWRDGSWTGADWADASWTARSWRDAGFSTFGWQEQGWD